MLIRSVVDWRIDSAWRTTAVVAVVVAEIVVVAEVSRIEKIRCLLTCCLCLAVAAVDLCTAEPCVFSRLPSFAVECAVEVVVVAAVVAVNAPGLSPSAVAQPTDALGVLSRVEQQLLPSADESLFLFVDGR